MDKIQQPVVVTDAAIAAIKDLRIKQNNPELAIRLGVRGGGCSGYSYLLDMDLDPPKPKDILIQKDGVVLYVDPKSLKLLEGMVLDYFKTLTSQGFKFENPNAIGTCGCGSSFSIA